MTIGAVDIASAQHSATPAIELTAKGDIQIGPDGHVTDYQLKSQLSPAVAQLVDRTVRGWHFKPILVDGKPVNAKTAMSIRLHGAPKSGDSYLLTISSVDFGTLTRSKLVPPKYPTDAARVGLGARVVLYLLIDADGKVVQAIPGQTSLDLRARSEHEAETWRERFEKVSVEAALQWQYDPSEFVDGKAAKARYAIAPIEFSIAPSERHGTPKSEWKTYLPGPVHPAPWDKAHPDGPPEQRFADLANGETASTNSNFQLEDDVIGKAL
ncbi:MAG TPA: energy transducer TonB [Rhodanobacteraceae bacterium]|nr:energy transducer TonB [Rhodanobacteraceae bacterium]